MQLLLIRHGVAEDRESFAATGQDDELRPLTEIGQNQMRAIAAGLKASAPSIDLLATSPLLRAQQTAAIVQEVHRIANLSVTDALVPGTAPRQFLKWLRKQRAEVVAVVGHEPDLSALVGWLLTGRSRRLLAFEKGGACLLSFDGRPRRKEAVMEWAMPPEVLQRVESRE